MRNRAFQSQDSIKLIENTLDQLGFDILGKMPNQVFPNFHPTPAYGYPPFYSARLAVNLTQSGDDHLPESDYRELYRQGSINDRDLSEALAHFAHLHAEQNICRVGSHTITREAVYRCALLADFSPLPISQLQWLIEEKKALTKLQADVPPAVRQWILADADDEAKLTSGLWAVLSTEFGLANDGLDCEGLLDLSGEQAGEWLAKKWSHRVAHEDTQQKARRQLLALWDKVGTTYTFGGLIFALSGIDIMDSVKPQLINICASGMDSGFAPWHFPQSEQPGLYAAWRATLNYDANLFLHELPDWQQVLEEMPDEPLATIAYQLTELGIDQSRWGGYLQCLVLEMPDWPDLIYWQQQQSDFRIDNRINPDLADYLAIRLTLDRLWLSQVCRDIWKVEASLGTLQGYFNKNLSELLVRLHLYQKGLPEYLAHQAEGLITRSGSERSNREDWRHLADLIETWQISPLAQCQSAYSKGDSVWPLFRLCQHLGLKPESVANLGQANLLAFLSVLDSFGSNERNNVWVVAYERHYREALFEALHANRKTTRQNKPCQRPEAQIVVGIDAREESFRRYIEASNPAIETFGTACYAGLASGHSGQDKCPPLPSQLFLASYPKQNASLQWNNSIALLVSLSALLKGLIDFSQQGLRRNILLLQRIMIACTPLGLINMLGKVLFSNGSGQLCAATSDAVKACCPLVHGSVLSDNEQADLIAKWFRTLGLTDSFAPLVVLMGQTPSKQNMVQDMTDWGKVNCIPCDGNLMRAFAATANRPEIRALLQENGIFIPSDTWFVGAEHNFCSETISWYEEQTLSVGTQLALNQLCKILLYARQHSAHERCRRLLNAPRNPSLKEALNYIGQQGADDHTKPTAAIIGRRSITRSVFLDRQVLLISYDSMHDPDSELLENILLTLLPTLGDSNQKYYYADGVAQQMFAGHKEMRFQLIVEAKTDVLARIYSCQLRLQELIGGGWVQLAAVPPNSSEFYIFEPGDGFVQWHGDGRERPVYADSLACYAGQNQPLPPQLLKPNQPR